MSTQADATAESLARVIGTLLDLGQAGIDWNTVVQAVLAFREEQHQRLLDAGDEPSARRNTRPSRGTDPADASALTTEVNGAALASLLRVGRDWQRLLQNSAPALKAATDAYRAEPVPSYRTTRALVDQLAIFGHSVGDFMQDQGALLRHDLLVFEEQVLRRHSV